VDNKESVQGTLGRPTFTGQFSPNDWYYYARDTKQLAFRNPRPTAQTILHVQFDNAGNVIAVNQRGMENVVQLSPEGDKTPTLGRNTSFFEELFGNIGAVGAPGAGRQLEARAAAHEPISAYCATPAEASTAKRDDFRRARRHGRDLHRLFHAHQHRADHLIAAQFAQQLCRQIGRLQPGHHQHIGGT
jgi:hypothetical protein